MNIKTGADLAAAKPSRGRIGSLQNSAGVLCASLTAGFLLLWVVAAAQPARAEGDAKAGASKAVVCSACHGSQGISGNPLWPSLAGQHQPYLEKQIKAFRDGDRVEPTMQPFVASLSDQDIADIAAHFAGLSPCP